jgi:hypothetical protein
MLRSGTLCNNGSGYEEQISALIEFLTSRWKKIRNILLLFMAVLIDAKNSFQADAGRNILRCGFRLLRVAFFSTIKTIVARMSQIRSGNA